MVRTRSEAAELVLSGHVRVNGARQTSPGRSVKTGDVLTVALDTRVRLVKVVSFADRRGDTQAAHALYEDLQAKQE